MEGAMHVWGKGVYWKSVFSSQCFCESRPILKDKVDFIKKVRENRGIVKYVTNLKKTKSYIRN